MEQTPLPPLLGPTEGPPVEILGEGGSGIVLACEHASHTVPEALDGLGLAEADRTSHAAWDPGARALGLALSARLDAPLVAARFSRLVHDCNRPDGADDAMPEQVERITVPGNRAITPPARAARIAALAQPFHAALSDQLDAAGPKAVLVTIHSFTPVWHGTPRDTQIGFLHDADDRLVKAMAKAPGLSLPVAINSPYGPQDGVTHTLIRHALPRGALNVMVEIRNDLLADATGIAAIADELTRALTHGLAACGHAAAACREGRA